MTKRATTKQLQAELNTDEEFQNFITDTPGLLGWCGPCSGLVSTLRKIQLDVGLSAINYAVCKADSISYLKRFYRRSKPTWLFVREGKAVNLCFGANVPKLVNLIYKDLFLAPEDRVYYEIDELQPQEKAELQKKLDAIYAAENKIKMEEDEKRRNYLTHVTNSIMDNMHDIGVTVFCPIIGREDYKTLLAPAEKLNLQCLDRKIELVRKEDFEIINFEGYSDLRTNVIEYLDGRQLFMCLWRSPDRKPIEVSLSEYQKELTRLPNEDEDSSSRPILRTLEIPIFDPERIEEDTKQEVESLKSVHSNLSKYEEREDFLDLEEYYYEEMGEEYEHEEYAQEEKLIPVTSVKPSIKKPTPKPISTLKIPPVFVPNNPRAHAALIYLYFRNHTKHFLEPDPIPDPPCIIVAFDSHKRNEVLKVINTYPADIEAMGFFTSDEPDKAELIALTPEKYSTVHNSFDDKIIIKVKKETSLTMLALASYGPCYVSPSVDIGKEEAQIFFPKNQISPKDELDELERQREALEAIEAQLRKERQLKAMKERDRRSSAGRYLRSRGTLRTIPSDSTFDVENLSRTSTYPSYRKSEYDRSAIRSTIRKSTLKPEFRTLKSNSNDSQLGRAL